MLRRFWPENGASNGLPALDGARGIAVLLVMVYHAWHLTPNLAPANEDIYPLYWTRTGVHLFFVLSGFLLFTPYAQWLFGLRARPSTRLFYLRRILRVGPAYWTCLAILAVTAPLTASRIFDVAAHATFAFNLVPAYLASINSIFWTMAVEVQFYALLPVLAGCAYLVSRKRGALTGAAALVIGLAITSVLSGFLGTRLDPRHTHLVLTALFGQLSVTFYLSTFGLGAAASVAYVYVTRVAQSGRTAERARPYAVAGFIAGVLLVVGLALAAPYDSRFAFGKNGLFGVGYGLIVFGVMLGPRMLRAPFEWVPLRFFGFISYSLYLWHGVTFGAVSDVLAGVGDPTVRFLLGIGLECAVAVPVAYVSYMVAERPFMRARAQLRDDSGRDIHAASTPTISRLGAVAIAVGERAPALAPQRPDESFSQTRG